MEINKLELDAVQGANDSQGEIAELNELQLALVGGGGGEVVFHYPLAIEASGIAADVSSLELLLRLIERLIDEEYFWDKSARAKKTLCF